MIPYGRQSISEQDIQAVVEVLRSDWITQGPAIEQFEQHLAEKVSAKYALTLNSGTAALHVACQALGVQRGDIVWTSPNTFVASANCALYCGASVDFVDIDPRTYNLSAEALEEKLQRAEKQGKLPKLVIPVHFAGQSCDMAKIHALATQYGFKIIEDAAHAIGGYYQGRPIGACQYSDITIFSFHPVKQITTGEGGAILTNNSQLFKVAERLRSHGITRNPDQLSCSDPWYYEQIDLGYNYRITDIQAALGSSQLRQLDEFISARRKLAMRYNAELEALPIRTPFMAEGIDCAWHLYVIQLELTQLGISRREVFEKLRMQGIGTQVHYIPVHLQPYYSAMGFKPGDFPNAEQYYQAALSIPLYPTLQVTEQDQVVTALKEALT